MAIHNSQATFRFTTDAPLMYIRANPTIYGVFPQFAYVRISIDGFYSYVRFTSNDYISVSLGLGTKTVEITEPLISMPVATILGTFLNSVMIPDGYDFTIIDTDTPATKWLFFGDSITVGGNADFSIGYPLLYRDNGTNTSVYGYGYGAIYTFASNAGQITTTVGYVNTLMDGTGANVLNIMLGCNDYGIYDTPAWTTTEFQAQYDALLQAINTARNDITINCLSPIVRNPDGANSNGETLADFRTAVSNAVGVKAYATYVDTSAMLVVGDLADGVHPTTAGHIKLYDALVLAL